jgi:hypothetical protein
MKSCIGDLVFDNSPGGYAEMSLKAYPYFGEDYPRPQSGENMSDMSAEHLKRLIEEFEHVSLVYLNVGELRLVLQAREFMEQPLPYEHGIEYWLDELRKIMDRVEASRKLTLK